MRGAIVIFLLLVSMQLAAQFNAGKYQDIHVMECTDQDGDEVYFTITAGNTDGFYQILPCSGLLQVDTLAYTKFLRQKTWTLTIACTDPRKYTDKSVYKVTLKKTAAGVKLDPVIVLYQP
jgi:hypothetical protein